MICHGAVRAPALRREERPGGPFTVDSLKRMYPTAFSGVAAGAAPQGGGNVRDFAAVAIERKTAVLPPPYMGRSRRVPASMTRLSDSFVESFDFSQRGWQKNSQEFDALRWACRVAGELGFEGRARGRSLSGV